MCHNKILTGSAQPFVAHICFKIFFADVCMARELEWGLCSSRYAICYLRPSSPRKCLFRVVMWEWRAKHRLHRSIYFLTFFYCLFQLSISGQWRAFDCLVTLMLLLFFLPRKCANERPLWSLPSRRSCKRCLQWCFFIVRACISVSTSRYAVWGVLLF